MVSINAQKDCLQPAYAGMQMLGIGIALDDLVTWTRGSDLCTKNHVSSITFRRPSLGQQNSSGGSDGCNTTGSSSNCCGPWFAIEAGGSTPWTDTSEEFDADTQTYTKTVSFYAPRHGGAFATQFVEPLTKNQNGYVFILQRKDRYSSQGDGAFVIFGLENGCICTEATMNYTETEGAGCMSFTMVETGAPSSEITLYSGGGSDSSGCNDGEGCDSENQITVSACGCDKDGDEFDNCSNETIDYASCKQMFDNLLKYTFGDEGGSSSNS
ncbi:MAG: hypothetical protein LUJ25_09175 [Firmicutes bacterium]|nr:hypothetical protein [Bacillota bacterium]